MSAYERCLALVEEALVPQLERLGEIPPGLKESMRYSLEGGGKRIRPVMLLLTAEAMGVPDGEALPYACALEMIHTYSLIHDDLPAMDDDDTRRGKASNHIVFGEGQAVLAGDGLLSAAMELMLLDAQSRPDLRGTRAAYAIARRCGVTGMVAGQSADLSWEGTEVTIEKVRYIHTHKTADLLTAPVEAGLLLAGAEESALALGRTYGLQLGLAFQIVDDILDVTGDPALLGKKTGLDAAAGKQTWVALRGLDGARKDARRCTEEAIEAISQLPGDFSPLAVIARMNAERVR